MADSLVPPWLEPLLTAPFFTTCRSHNDSPRSERNMFCLDCPSGTAFCFYCRSSSHSGHRTIQIRRSSYHDVVRVSEIQKVLDIAGVQTYVINSARVLFLNERPQPKTGHSTTTTSSSLVVSGNLNGGGGGGGVLHHICETCSRTLLDPFRFCSLGCKLEGIKKKGNACFVVDEMIGAEAAENEEEEQEQEEKRRRKGGDETIGTSSKRWRRRSVIRRTVGGGEVLLVESSNSDQYGHGRQGTAAAAAAAAAMCPSSSSSPPTILLPTSQTTTAAAAGNNNNNNNRSRKGIPHRSPLASS